MRRTIQQALVIVVFSVTLGLLVNAISPRGIPYIRPPAPELAPEEVVALAEAEELWNTGAAFFLDARTAADYAAGHISSAFNVPVEAFDERFPIVARMLSLDTPIVTYCDGVDCELSHQLAIKLRALGYENTRVLVNGWTVWRTAGLPTTTGEEP